MDKDTLLRIYDPLKSQLIKHEGIHRFPYTDTEGKLTIGIGRNLTDRGLSGPEIDFLYDNDISSVLSDLNRTLPWWRNLSPNRQLVLIDMCFNLGIKKLLGFSAMIAALHVSNYPAAADEMMDSKWARQVKGRAEFLSKMMRTG